MTPRLALIAAVGRNNVIGAEGKLPWHLPSDLALFKRVTMGKPLIMGRRTWEAIGRALPGRSSFVITHKPGYKAPGATVMHSFEEALKAARKVALADRVEEVFVIGGGQLYRRAMKSAERLYITHVDAAPPGDVTFPPIDPAVWVGWASSDVEPSESDSAEYEVRIYERR